MTFIAAQSILSLYIESEGQIISGPCWLYGVDLMANGTGNTIINLYDGSGTKAKQKLKLQAAVKEQTSFRPAFPVYFRAGLYIENDQNMRAAFIQLLPAS